MAPIVALALFSSLISFNRAAIGDSCTVSSTLAGGGTCYEMSCACALCPDGITAHGCCGGCVMVDDLGTCEYTNPTSNFVGSDAYCPSAGTTKSPATGDVCYGCGLCDGLCATCGDGTTVGDCCGELCQINTDGACAQVSTATANKCPTSEPTSSPNVDPQSGDECSGCGLCDAECITCGDGTTVGDCCGELCQINDYGYCVQVSTATADACPQSGDVCSGCGLCDGPCLECDNGDTVGYCCGELCKINDVGACVQVSTATANECPTSEKSTASPTSGDECSGCGFCDGLCITCNDGTTVGECCGEECKINDAGYCVQVSTATADECTSDTSTSTPETSSTSEECEGPDDGSCSNEVITLNLDFNVCSLAPYGNKDNWYDDIKLCVMDNSDLTEDDIYLIFCSLNADASYWRASLVLSFCTNDGCTLYEALTDLGDALETCLETKASDRVSNGYGCSMNDYSAELIYDDEDLCNFHTGTGFMLNNRFVIFIGLILIALY